MHPEPLAPTTLDFGATNNRLQGNPSGRFLHGYYKYLPPVAVFCGEHLLSSSNERARLIPQPVHPKHLKDRGANFAELPYLKVTVRGDSGFCRESVMARYEENEVHLHFGLPKSRVS